MKVINETQMQRIQSEFKDLIGTGEMSSPDYRKIRKTKVKFVTSLFIRESFPFDQQFNILMRFIVDQTQTPNLKVKQQSEFYKLIFFFFP